MSERTEKYLLRIEGANLRSFIYDTRDLSTVRGGSLLLLEAASRRCAELLRSLDVYATPVSGGASVALFEVTPGDGRTPEVLREQVELGLRCDQALQHATFLVDLAPVGEYVESTEAVLARNRHRQYQAASLAVPALNCAGGRNGQYVCEKDAIRPAQLEAGQVLSSATRVRRDHGRELKQGFCPEWSRLEDEPDLSFAYRFARDFEEIAAAPRSQPLANKLAVFYVDGNRFGAIGRKVCGDVERHRKWDAFLRHHRRLWLRTFLRDELLPDTGRRWVGGSDTGQYYRFEVLLWGGDEMLFVMPAWNGWRFARQFFAATERWTVPDDLTSPGGVQRLTHTAALVFCHRSAPIHRIQALAKEQMAEFAKSVVEQDGSGQSVNVGRQRNQLVYQVLESFDHLGTSYEAALRSRYRACPLEAAHLVLADRPDAAPSLAEQLGGIAEGILELDARRFPRSQLRALVHQLAAAGGECAPEHVSSRFESGGEDFGTRLMDLRACCASDAALWVHLEELWDYARP